MTPIPRMHVSRRDTLKSFASGFGYLAFASLAHSIAAKGVAAEEAATPTGGGALAIPKALSRIIKSVTTIGKISVCGGAFSASGPPTDASRGGNGLADPAGAGVCSMAQAARLPSNMVAARARVRNRALRFEVIFVPIKVKHRENFTIKILSSQFYRPCAMPSRRGSAPPCQPSGVRTMPCSPLLKS